VNLGFAQDEAIDLAEAFVSKAFELEPDFPPALAIRGAVEVAHRADLRGSVKSLKKALAANPNDTVALVFLAATLLCQGGKPEAARPLVERMAEIDPLSYPTHWLLGALPFFQGEFENASIAWGRLHEMTPGNPMYEFYFALALACGGNRDRALEVLREPDSMEAEGIPTRFCHMLRCALLNDGAGVVAQLTPEFHQTASRDGEWAYHVAARLAPVDHAAEALEWLGYALDAGFINYPMLADHDPFLSTLHGDARYEVFAEHVKSEWESFTF
jgi:tetratricopeptide (TPR) repeat protein